MNRMQGLLLLLVCAAGGCATHDPLSSDMSAWQGENVSVALEHWGAPEDRRAFGGETILVWRDRASHYSPSGQPGKTGLAAVICERMLAVADDGTITGWRWRGNACDRVAPGDRTGELAAAR